MVRCQEEPQNQGAWDQLKHRFQYPVKKGVELIYAGRPASASPAVGVFGLHVKQQEQLVNDALLGAGV